MERAFHLRTKMGIQNYKENLEKLDIIYQMDLKELKIERKRLKDLIANYDSWGTAQSINTKKYHTVIKLISLMETNPQ